MTIQIFGLPKSQATRAAKRFFNERRVPIQMVALARKPLAPTEIGRFIDRYGLPALLDTESKAYIDAGLKYMKLSGAELLARIEKDPKLLRLPLVRSPKLLSVGHAKDAWQAMLSA